MGVHSLERHISGRVLERKEYISTLSITILDYKRASEMDMGKFVWLLVALLAFSSGFVIATPGYGSGNSLLPPIASGNNFDPGSKPVASAEDAEDKESAPQAEAVRDDAMSQQQLKQAFGKHMKSKSMGTYQLSEAPVTITRSLSRLSLYQCL